MIWMFTGAGARTPFDPEKVRLDGCLLCGRRVASVGVFIPSNDMMQTVVLTLRRHSEPAMSNPALIYGLCLEHYLDPVAATDAVDARFIALAAQVTVQ